MEKIRQEKNLNVPNMLTILRFLLLPVFVWKYLDGSVTAALVVYVVVQLSDLLDGYIARRWNLITEFGKLMDPLADKFMLLAVLICFGIKEQIPWWVIGLVLGKEALMIVGGIFALRRKIVVAALRIGKIATGVFALAVVGMLINNQTDALGIVPTALLYLAVAITFWALVVYIRNLQRVLSMRKERE